VTPPVDTDGGEDSSALAGISAQLSEWQHAVELQEKAAATGFDWPDYRLVLDKLAEELDEVRHEFEHGANQERLADEIGDLLFVAANLARHAKVDISRAMRGANQKFERRFRGMEALAEREGRTLSSYSLEEQETLWTRVKQNEPKL
jgi:nucleoside triphosphate diphosphatase